MTLEATYGLQMLRQLPPGSWTTLRYEDPLRDPDAELTAWPARAGILRTLDCHGGTFIVLTPGSRGAYSAVVIRTNQAATTCGPGEGRAGSMTDSAPGGQPIRVFLLDDHEVVRRGMCDLLEAEPDIQVIGEAGTAAAALARIRALRPDVAILDVRLPEGDGIAVCREVRIHVPDTACLMLTAYEDDRALRDAIMAGCAGYMLKKIRSPGLVAAVRKVASGQPVLDPDATGKLLDWLRDQSSRRELLPRLSGREQQILELIGEGLTNRQIGERMGLAEKTVKNYVSSLLTKLGMHHRTEAAAFSVRRAAGHRDGAAGPRDGTIRDSTASQPAR